MPTTALQRRAALIASALVVVLALGWALWPRGGDPVERGVRVPAQAVVAGTVLKSAECGDQATQPFRPTRISIKVADVDAPVIALGRDANNVPEAPAISALGKTQYAWDDPTQNNRPDDALLPPGAMPGAPTGHVLMNAHTWPDDSALGNKMLDHLEVGGRIILRGKHAELCYKVVRRVVIKASDGSPEYYQQGGPAELAIISCSPPRLGPGDWLNRTIWFAEPLTASDPA
ncbi:MAG TPA: class F sortase [Marmoricola sp.]|jgi:hypothetical protein|nr:class F sortase [Marmoricola sp.]